MEGKDGLEQSRTTGKLVEKRREFLVWKHTEWQSG